ncbi:general substrate transporter [Rhodocollybia butyracea]|uniref:Quinate transporter n=1 Tax=Rhodocollybia butyracea TaxID=206335 RepID=A0A9P5Q7J1_9AGAR|nr:general substrate transporter [Rhodocollybia butyracea]
MVSLARVEDRPTPSEVYNWRIYFNAFAATFAAVMIGYDSAFIGTSISLASFKREFGLNTLSTDQFGVVSANIVSTFQAGAFFGALFGYPVGYFWGRKYGLLFSSVIFCIGAALQIGASSKTGLGIVYAGRAICGLAIGAASNLAPIFVAEIAPPAIRGRLIGLYELCWQIGGVVGFWINYGVTLHIPAGHKQWIIAFAVQLIPGGLLFIGSLLLSESPRWLMSRDREEDALRSLAYLRNLPRDAPYVQQELTETREAIRHERSLAGAGFFGPLRTVFSSSKLIWRAALASSLFAWQNATGINAINYYSPTIFTSIGVTGSSGLLTTGVYGIIKMVGAGIWLMYLIDTLGRRKILMIGSIGGALSMYYIGAYIAIAEPAEHPSTVLSAGGKSAVAFFYIWTIFYSPTWNGTPWVVSAEFFPQHVRTFTSAISGCSNWGWTFIISRFTPQMFETMGFGVYLFFASLMILSIPYVYFLLPETKCIPLEYMDDLFGADVKPWNAYNIVIERVAANHRKITSQNEAEQGKGDVSMAENTSEKDEERY